jgi:hypothetical protein
MRFPDRLKGQFPISDCYKQAVAVGGEAPRAV